jgi:hypothetical protein
MRSYMPASQATKQLERGFLLVAAIVILVALRFYQADYLAAEEVF